ncbi:MAG TPA: NAD(P)/FAD-dependent oxidoreductase [Vicinamibacterales bacterium]
MSDAIIIGAGHNGLVTAFYLAKAGLKPLVLESRAAVGGCVTDEEFAPGFKAPLAHAIGPLRTSVVNDMGLARRIRFIQPDPRLVTLSPDGHALAFSTDVPRTVEAIRPFSQRDAEAYPEFCATLERLGGFLAHLLELTPPDIDGPAAGEMWDLLKVGKRFRTLGRKDGFRLLRWGPMAAADLVAEFFESDLLQAALAARGVFGTAQGPWSAGSGAVLLLNAAIDPAPGGRSLTIKGGLTALADAMGDAARGAGAEIRTGARVSRVIVHEGRARGVVLEGGEEIEAPLVISSADPRRTFLELIDPIELDPGFLMRARNYRSRGTVAKVHLALNTLPSFAGVANPADLHGRILIGPSVDYLERAFDPSKYGEIPGEPYIELTIPTMNDPELAPANRHVLSAHVQFVPYHLREGSWEENRDRLASIVIDTIERYSPGLRRFVEATQVLTPADLERQYGLTGGHIYHGEPALDQLFTMRPFLGWAKYVTPIRNLFLCGSGTHPGGGITGGSGQNAAREIVRLLKKK